MDRYMFVRDQADGPRSANFAKHMNVDNVSSPTNVQIVKVLDINFQMKFIRKFTSGFISQNADG